MQLTSAAVYRIGTEVGFGPSSSGISLLANGWSAPDPGGFTWSAAPDACLRFSIATPTRDMVGRLDVMPFVVAGTVVEQRMEIYFNHVRVGYAELQAGRQSVAFALPRELFIMRTASLLLHIPGAVSPQQLGLSDDQRRLGVALWSLQIAAAS